ncbi:ABC transporter ATP-binding protein [Corynebacterium lubricantis]|uniref:ABC transporter ATP-binding protein n=1 Tax=Corynebacterium lubricantis TaxID=541095 RepID=UPI000360D6BF|nr:ABC transporter ATP-binding protein [Corynebacterium lubricantis]
MNTATAPQRTLTDTVSADVITVRGLTRTYGTKKKTYTAVDAIDFSVARGEVYGLLGTNGAGKTSTLEILEGLAAPTAGSVTVLGMDPITQRQEVRRHTGIVLQDGGLPSQLTVHETMTMWAGTCSSPLPIDDVLNRVGLAHRLTIKVGSLSGGEKRRLDLACALVGNPSLLFLDEPTTGLDPESRRNVWKLLRELKAEGVTMVLTTHYLEEAEYLCDRISIMHKGTIHIEGSLSEIAEYSSARISFRAPEAPLPHLPGTAITRDGNAISISTDNLQADVLTILHWAEDNNITLEGFSADVASLEQVFLDIAGKDQ